MTDIPDKYRGSLIGGAVGDALGYAVEFLNETQIFEKFGKNGITQYTLHNGKALISDDTQMTMFTATALLDAFTRGQLRGIMGNLSWYIAFEYQGWYLTQTQKFPVDVDKNHEKYSWVMNNPNIFNQRSPGNTCLSALASGKFGTIENPINNSKGCGGIMRVAPVGLYFSISYKSRHRNLRIEEIDRIGAETAAITHGHELGYIPAAALVHIITLISHNDSCSLEKVIFDAVKTIKLMFSDCRETGYFTELIELAVSLAKSGGNDIENIHRLGEGWVAEETLAIAVYCALKYQYNFEKAICTAVNHKGDSDSTGAICGNILGAFLGYEAIPEKFRKNLEFHDELITLADDLYNDCQMNEYGSYIDKIWLEKYCYKTYKLKG